jgi:hypothetical protein
MLQPLSSPRAGLTPMDVSPGPGRLLVEHALNVHTAIQKTSLVVVQGLFAITGDLDAFAAVFGPSEEVQLVYVPNAV